MYCKRIICALIVAATVFQAFAGNGNAFSTDSCRLDSLKTEPLIHSEGRFKPTQLILPASLIAVGTFGVWNGAFHRLNHEIKDDMAEMRGNHYFHADDYIQYLPAAAYLGMGAIGVKSKNTFTERLAAGITAYAVMTIAVNSTKYSVKEKRPDSGARNSFPSGHTATAFVGAELIRLEYGTWPAVGAYTLATGVAFLRLYNDRHWFNDILAGAGIGILSAKVGYWMLPLYKKWFKWDKDKTMVMMSSVNVVDHNYGFCLTALF